MITQPVRVVERAGVTWLEAPALAATGLVAHAFATRRGGVDQVLGALSLTGRPLATVRQVHGNRVVVVRSPADAEAARFTEADGLITDSPQVALAVFTADCLPVLLVDPRRGAVAAVHSGWRGTVRRISGRTVALLGEEFGSRPQDLLAAIGPSIGPCCYEVDRPVLEAVAAAFPGTAGEFLTPVSKERARLDLRAAVARDLKETGVPDENVILINECTACRPDRYFSYRRDGRGTGRMAAVICLREGKGCLEEDGCPEVAGPGHGR